MRFYASLWFYILIMAFIVALVAWILFVVKDEDEREANSLGYGMLAAFILLVFAFIFWDIDRMKERAEITAFLSTPNLVTFGNVISPPTTTIVTPVVHAPAQVL